MITADQYVASICDLTGIDRKLHGYKFWVAMELDSNYNQCKDARIVEWKVEGISKPSDDDVKNNIKSMLSSGKNAATYINDTVSIFKIISNLTSDEYLLIRDSRDSKIRKSYDILLTKHKVISSDADLAMVLSVLSKIRIDEILNASR